MLLFALALPSLLCYFSTAFLTASLLRSYADDIIFILPHSSISPALNYLFTNEQPLGFHLILSRAEAR